MMKLQGLDLRDLEAGVNILDLNVPPQLDVQHETGIPFIDDIFSGGLTPSTATLFTGTPGAGKTTLMLQLADALTGRGHTVLFNTAEESLFQIRKLVRRLELKNGFVCGQDYLLSNVLAHATYLKQQAPAKQLFMIFDSLAVLDDGKYANGHTNTNTAVRVAESISSFCKSEENDYPIAFAIGHVNKSGDFAGKQTIKHAVDTHLHLYIDLLQKSETYGKHLIEVQKNRWGRGCCSYSLSMSAKGLTEEGITYNTVAA